MGTLSEVASPITGILSDGLGGIAKYAWVLIPFVLITIVIAVVFVIKAIKNKKAQWTHKLKIRRVLYDGGYVDGKKQKARLSDPFYIKMRRFPLIKKAEVFELEKPLLGGYLLPELDQYSGDNEFSIILDTNNRIYTNKGEFFDFDTNSVFVSAKHSEIDIQRANLKADFQNINKINKRIEWATIAKYAFFAVAIIAVMIVAIVGIQKQKALEAQSMAQAMDNLARAMISVEATVNTQKLEILPMMKEIYKTNNIQGIVNEDYNATSI